MQAFNTLSSTKLPVINYGDFITAEGYLCSRDDTSAKQARVFKQCGDPAIVLTIDGHAWTRPFSQATRFIPITLNERVVQVAVGVNHSVLLTERGRVWVSGSNMRGQLGLGEQMYSDDFTLVEKLPVVTQVAAFLWQKVAITDGGEVWVCGDNSYGQLGLGDYNKRNVFTHVSLSERVLGVNISVDNIVLTTVTGRLISGRSSAGYIESSFRPYRDY